MKRIFCKKIFESTKETIMPPKLLRSLVWSTCPPEFFLDFRGAFRALRRKHHASRNLLMHILVSSCIRRPVQYFLSYCHCINLIVLVVSADDGVPLFLASDRRSVTPVFVSFPTAISSIQLFELFWRMMEVRKSFIS